MNDALWIWSIGLLAFIGFNLWYNNWRGPLTAAEISKYTDRLKTRLEKDGGSVDGIPFYRARLLVGISKLGMSRPIQVGAGPGLFAIAVDGIF